MSVKVITTDDSTEKLVPHGVDVYKEDLDGEFWWLQDNEYLYRGYRTQLTFFETFKSAFRSTNETMNIWTHYIGALMFIFLLYLTYAIPVNIASSIRKDVLMTTAMTKCSAIQYEDVISDLSRQNTSCFDAVSQDDRVAEDFSNLYYHLSKTMQSQFLPNLTNTFSPFFSYLENNSLSELPTGLFNTLKSTTSSLMSSLLNWLQLHPSSPDSSNLHKSIEAADILLSDLSTLSTLQKAATHSVPRWPIIVFLCCAIWCLGGSAIYHQYYCTNFIVSNVLQTIDYCGICILISGSYVPIIYYCFYCHPTALWTHLIIVVILNVANLCVMATPKFRQPEYRSIRARSFTLVACYAVVSVVHIYLLEGFKNSMFSVAFWYIVGMGGTYILGAVLYGTRIPEKYFPGHFDYVLSSHQLFHVCIVIAALFHYVGSYQLFVDRLNTPCMGN